MRATGPESPAQMMEQCTRLTSEPQDTVSSMKRHTAVNVFTDHWSLPRGGEDNQSKRKTIKKSRFHTYRLDSTFSRNICGHQTTGSSVACRMTGSWKKDRTDPVPAFHSSHRNQLECTRHTPPFPPLVADLFEEP